jgi:Protein of unknown function (DUF3105)
VGRTVRLLVAVALGVAAVVGILLFVQARDRSTFGDESGGAPVGRTLPDQGADHKRPPAGFRYASDPPASGPHLVAAVRRDGTLSRDQLLTALEAGNVVLVYGARGDEGFLRGIQEDVAGPFDPTLAGAGQAVILDFKPGTQGVVAVAWRRELRARNGRDQKLRAFADAWLGKGAQQ